MWWIIVSKKIQSIICWCRNQCNHIDQSLIELNNASEVSQSVSQMKLWYCKVLNKDNLNEEKLIEETPNPQDNYRQATAESEIINDDEVYEIAPEENQPTKSIIFDDHCEDIDMPTII